MNTNEVNQHIQELEKLRCQTRRFRLLTIVALLAIVIAGVSAIISSIYSLALAGPKQDAFVKHLGVNMQNGFLPIVQGIASRSFERLKPKVDAEIKNLNARVPQIADAAVLQLDIMSKELPIHADRILDKTVGDTLRKREDKLRNLYPGIYDKQVASLLGNLNLEAQDQLAKSGEKIFRPHLDSIQSILANLEKIQKTEPIDEKAQIDSWQVAFMFADVFVREFKDLDVPNTVKPKETKQ